MNPNRHIQLRWLQGTLSDITVTSVQMWQRAPQSWQPPINAFRCESCVRICVDLAGVDKSMIDLTVEPRRVVVRGSRPLPEPSHHQGRALRVLALEIDYGSFEREVHLPAEIDVNEAHAEQLNGLLWISLPLKK